MTSERRRSTLRRLAFITAGVFASASVVPSPALKTDPAGNRAPLRCVPAARSAGPGPLPCPAGGAPPTAEATRSSAFGAYLNYGPSGVKLMSGFSRWLGGTEVQVGRTYLPGDLWSNIEGAPGFLDSWVDWRRAKDDRLFVLNVPLMERNEAHLPDAEVRQLLRRAASGEFDEHFQALAQHLVDLGAPDTVLVLGWEMNGVTYTHRCGPAPEDWKTYWRRIVTAMRSVPGQKFRFDFAPNRGADSVPWPECYPGDDVVDIVGMDSYDQPTGITFDKQVSEPYGLQYQVDFAKAHGKPISYPEWGLYHNGDSVTYMLRMLAWMDEHKPLYNTIADYCPHGVWLCSTNDRAAALYRAALFGQRTPEPEPSVPGSPAPTTAPEPQPSPNPSPSPSPAPTLAPATTPAAETPLAGRSACPCKPTRLLN
ncbi:glycoside hydrolase family 26 protein [Streptomyces sp. NPDC101151]|uniref:glycoside hydrolase family 26 protein n=1 Tax=Streptomyces sp. NPDC101151 TaxID=3366115 RepID=UPI0037FCFABA